VAVLLMGVILVAGCTQQQAADSLKIGVVASNTGSASTTGKDIWQSAVLAAEEINADGGVYIKDLGKKVPVEVILGDDESTREGGQKAVSKLITNDKVDILVGGFSSAVVSSHQSIVNDHNVPYIVTGASSPIITHRTDMNTNTTFHYCPTTDDYGRQTTLFANEVIRPAINEKFGFSEDRPLRMALVYQDSPYGKGVQTAVMNTIERENLPIVIVANETFKMGETDFRTILTSVKAAKPDVVYPATFINEQIPLVTQARREVGVNAIFLAVECKRHIGPEIRERDSRGRRERDALVGRSEQHVELHAPFGARREQRLRIETRQRSQQRTTVEEPRIEEVRRQPSGLGPELAKTQHAGLQRELDELLTQRLHLPADGTRGSAPKVSQGGFCRRRATKRMENAAEIRPAEAIAP